jgi:hypothetical protein
MARAEQREHTRPGPEVEHRTDPRSRRQPGVRQARGGERHHHVAATVAAEMARQQQPMVRDQLVVRAGAGVLDGDQTGRGELV